MGFSLISTHHRTRTLPFILVNYMSFEATEWRRHIVKGPTVGAMKG